MDQAKHSKMVSFIWGIADDVLRDLFKRGKYPDVILPMCVLRRLDVVLEPTKRAVLEMKKTLDKAKVADQRDALCEASAQAFYNTSAFTMRDLASAGSRQRLLQDFNAYLDGFSPNVQDILENFKFRNQIPTLSKADALGPLIEKFIAPEVDLSPANVDNHAMGTVFEELVRRFNEDNNEEAGEHWTPRDAVSLMAELVFRPIEERIKAGTYTIYDCACGTGGMLTLADDRLGEIAKARNLRLRTQLYGQEINPETYAVCKADMILKGEGKNAEFIAGGAEWSTLSNDAYPTRSFDFLLSNPPYGKSWKKDFETLGGKENFSDPRFKVVHKGEELSLVTRTSDGQMLFLVNMVSKMSDSGLGSRIAEVHNGSSLFTGDAGQGESNIRRWIIENDWLEAIVALPLNLFYNTGIATYIWVISNRKSEERRGKVQLIDATEWYESLRKNLGKKNCELSKENIEKVMRTFLEFKATPQSKIFRNEELGYWKVTVERPLRLVSQITRKAIESLRFASGDEELRQALYDEFGDDLFGRFSKVERKLARRLDEWGEDSGEEGEGEEDEAPAKKELPEKKRRKLLDKDTWKRDGRLTEVAAKLRENLGADIFLDHNEFRAKVDAALEKLGEKLSGPELKLLYKATSWRSEEAPPVIAKVHKVGKAEPDPIHGRFAVELGGVPAIVEYESDSELRDTEQVPLVEKGGTEAFIRREVLPYAPDAWVDEDKTKIGYEISFTRHFYKPQKLRSLEEIRADLAAAQKESEGLLNEILKGKLV